MGNKEQTTVNLTELAQEVKDDLAPIYTLKNILSAGLVLFGKLTEAEREQIIRIANGESVAGYAVPKPEGKRKGRDRPKAG